MRGKNMSDNNPKYLYHYTNISSLALILKNKNLKLNPLTVLDDSEEANIKDEQKHIAKYCYVSSWTDNDKESIPMWNMYTKMEEGIRIKLPSYPFKEYSINESTYRNSVGDNYEVKGSLNCIVNSNKFFSSEYFILTNVQQHILHKVQYTDESELLNPNVIDIDSKNNTTTFKMGDMGKYKNNYWAFQDEWRYILNIFPFGYKEMQECTSKGNINELLKKLYKGYDLPFNFYLLDLAEDKFLDMEITLSPKISEGNRIIVKDLIEKYNPEAQLNESELFNKIRQKFVCYYLQDIYWKIAFL